MNAEAARIPIFGFVEGVRCYTIVDAADEDIALSRRWYLTNGYAAERRAVQTDSHGRLWGWSEDDEDWMEGWAA